MMEQIFVYKNNKKTVVELVRYFRYKNTNYFIYSTHEIDDKGYIKLYIVKIMNIIDSIVVVPVKDKKEWSTMKDMVKTIIKDLQDGKEDFFIDLDYKELHGITLYEAKSFKMDSKLLDKLLVDYEEGSSLEDIMSDIKVNESLLKSANKMLKEKNENYNIEFLGMEELDDSLTAKEKYDKVQSYLVKLREETIDKIVEAIEVK